MTQSVARERVMKARAKMLIKYPFFAVLMMSMEMVLTDTLPDGQPLPTAATDMKTIFINEQFVESIDDDTLIFVLAHEIDHAAKKHCLRRGGRHPLAWNVACDYSNNLFLKDCGFKIWDAALLDERFRDESGFAMSADRIFNILMKEAQDEQSGGQRGQGSGEDGDDQQGSGSGSSPPGIGEEGNQHHSPMLGDIQEPDEVHDPVERDKLEREVQNKVAQAATVAKMMGDMPGALERFVNQILAPQVPWYEKLRHLMSEMKPDDEDWSRRNRRCRTAYLPADYSEHMGGIGIINDTSASIGDDELIKMNSEAHSVIEDLKPEWVRIFWADAHVASEQLFEPGDPFVPKPAGGGGTDMRVPLREMEQHEPDVVLLFTDGHTPWPKEEPPYPLIVCCTTQVAVPIGDVIRLD
jgi:predicted metal-dependent peptidase